mgnify:CR=1 FL=1
MALTISEFGTPTLGYKILKEDGATTGAISFHGNATGSSGTLHDIYVTNGAAGMFLKIYFGSAAAKSDDPDLKIQIQSGQTELISLPGGVAFTELSFFSTTDEATGASPTAPGVAVVVYMITS